MIDTSSSGIPSPPWSNQACSRLIGVAQQPVKAIELRLIQLPVMLIQKPHQQQVEFQHAAPTLPTQTIELCTIVHRSPLPRYVAATPGQIGLKNGLPQAFGSATIRRPATAFSMPAAKQTHQGMLDSGCSNNQRYLPAVCSSLRLTACRGTDPQTDPLPLLVPAA